MAAQNYYNTNFPANENPLSEGGNWVDGLTTGVHWGDISTASGIAHATNNSTGCPGTPNACNDSHAALTGTWGANQSACTTVFISGSLNRTNFYELEVHLHRTITSGNSTGYEFNYSTQSTASGGSPYMQIVRWDGYTGGNQSFTVLTTTQTPGGTPPNLNNGDTFCASAVGGTLTSWVVRNNAVLVKTVATDSTYAGGAPGLGLYNNFYPLADNALFGFSSFTAANYTAATGNQTDLNTLINGPTHTAVNGDSFLMPPGSYTWNAGITVPDSIGVQIFGSGTQNTSSICTASSQVGCGAGTPTTIITDSAGGSHMLVQTPTVGNALARISTIQFVVGATTSQAISIGGHCTAAGCPNVRIDNLVVPPWSVGSLSFSFMTNVFGVMDHNTATYKNTTGLGTNETFVDIGHGHYVGNVNQGGASNWGDSSWSSADTFGTNQTLYLENNRISMVGTDTEGSDGNGTWGGARFVCRFNFFPVIHQNGACTAHGTDTGGRQRGVRQWEMYGNFGQCTQNNGSPANCNSFAPTRGGVGRAWSNTVVSANGGGFLKSIGTTDTQRTWRLLGVWGTPNNNQCNGQSAWDNNDGVVYYPPSGTATVTAVSDTTVNGFNQWLLTLAAPGGGSPGWTTNQWAPATTGPASDYNYEFVDLTGGTGGAHPNFGYLIFSNTANTMFLQNDGNGVGGVPAVGDSFQILRSKVCLDQMGRSGGVLVRDTTNLSGIPVLTTTGNPGPVNQTLDPSYEANDNIGATATSTIPSSGNVILNRDTFSETVGQAANTSVTSPFNGSNLNGAGHGPFQFRPTCSGGCTINVGYLATDCPGATGCPAGTAWNSVPGGIQGVWFRWNGTTWVAETPFSYPHPLIGATSTPAVTLTPSIESCGSVNVGSSANCGAITLTNASGSSITIGVINYTGTNSTDFSTASTTCSGTIVNGGTCTVTPAFTPSINGNEGTALLNINYTGFSGSPVQASLTGTGVGAPVVSLNPAGLSFNPQQVGSSSASQPVTLQNTGNAPLTITSIALGGANPGDYSQTNNCPGSLGAGLSCTVNVTFTPTVVGSRPATLLFTDNAAGSPQSVTLTGSGTSGGIMSFAPGSIAFGNQIINTSSGVQLIYATNTGSSPITFGTITVTGDFFLVNNTACGGSIPVGGTCKQGVGFLPTATGLRTGTVIYTDNGVGSPQQVNVSGTGIPVPPPQPVQSGTVGVF